MSDSFSPETQLYNQNNLDEWVLKNDLPKHHKQFTQGQIDWSIRNRETNGLKMAVRKFGKQLYINIPLFNKWLHEKQD